MPTTEIAYAPLVAGSNPGDPNNPTAKVLKSVVDTLQTRDGMQQVHFGMWVEKPDTLQLMINWDSKQHHEDFKNDAAYPAFAKSIKPILAGDLTAYHVDFKPEGNLSKCFSAPVTEIATLYMDGNGPSDHYDTVLEFFQITEKDEAEKRYGMQAWAFGITHEEVERDGTKGKAGVLCIGWESVDKHMEFRQTPCFKDNIHLLRREAKPIEMHHVAFMEAQ